MAEAPANKSSQGIIKQALSASQKLGAIRVAAKETAEQLKADKANQEQ